ncbi:glycosyltransferase [Hoyosella sp. YIM 151337]|uniref:tetratricopeptide repeat-containing glycosyltransferase n=1 Tax=Hoyosella sp. YIM 151337 TaxID=2992742 RepID=UPI0022364C41|nr:glycosyltransferase [Hoyosella sp. YIM 151337]MCW4355446.1 glycosyltransferase [Hoyosella sp. YIM 151337]
MIVKNEARVIERCLRSVMGLIDTWVISDTGSTDGTQEIVRRCLSEIPGELHQDEWVDFGHNRSLNLQHAAGKADYLLLIDADMVVRTVGEWPTPTADSYMIRHEGDLLYRNRRLVSGRIAWRYEGVTHEFITSDNPASVENLDAIVVEHFADGGSRSDKFERDARLLAEDLQRHPANARSVFYLAQTMRDMGDIPEAVRLYRQRAAMGGWGEEVYYSLLQVGLLEDQLGNWPAAMDAFVQAMECRPSRLEACYELVSRLRTRGHHHTAHTLVKAALERPMPDDVLFVHPSVYRWGLLFEYSIVAYWVGDAEGSLRACDTLLAMDDLPSAIRERTRLNRKFPADKLAMVN